MCTTCVTVRQNMFSWIVLLILLFILGTFSTPVPENSAITSSPKQDTIFLANGNDIELSCTVEAVELTTNDIKWNIEFVDTTNAQPKTSYETDQQGNTIVTKTLCFSKFDAAKDAGIYICTYNTESVQFELIGVTEIKEEPEYDFSNKSVSELTLSCDVDAANRKNGDPVEVDNIKWFQNDIEVTQIPNDANRFIVNDTRLTITEVKCADTQYFAQFTFKGQQKEQYNCSVSPRGTGYFEQKALQLTGRGVEKSLLQIPADQCKNICFLNSSCKAFVVDVSSQDIKLCYLFTKYVLSTDVSTNNGYVKVCIDSISESDVTVTIVGIILALSAVVCLAIVGLLWRQDKACFEHQTLRISKNESNGPTEGHTHTYISSNQQFTNNKPDRLDPFQDILNKFEKETT